MATLGKYGIILKKESKGTLSNEVQSINDRGNIDGEIEEREQEILKQKKVIEEKVKNQNPRPKTNEFIVMAKYNQMIESLVEEMLQPMLEEKI